MNDEVMSAEPHAWDQETPCGLILAVSGFCLSYLGYDLPSAGHVHGPVMHLHVSGFSCAPQGFAAITAVKKHPRLP